MPFFDGGGKQGFLLKAKKGKEQKKQKQKQKK